MSQTEEEVKTKEEIVTEDVAPSTETKVDVSKSKKTKSTKAPVDVRKGISFRQFLAIHKKLWTGIEMSAGTPGHTQLMRQWNSMAIMFPEKCSDMIVWEERQEPKLINNDLNLSEL